MTRQKESVDYWITMERPSGAKKRSSGEPFRPYTVIDALIKEYGRCFVKDLQEKVDCCPKEYSRDPENWEAVRGKVVSFCVLRPESIFDQPLDSVYVDIAGSARIVLEEISKENPEIRRKNVVEETLRLRYLFDFRNCQMTCGYIGVIRDERDSLISMNPQRVHLDKYLIPVLNAAAYEMIPYWIRWNWFPETWGTDRPIDPEELIHRLEIPLLKGALGDADIQGEYFFAPGMEKIVEPDTEAAELTEVNPGSIVVSRWIHDYETAWGSTLAHEVAHAILGRYFYCLQRLQRGSYLPYVCKREKEAVRKQGGELSPFEQIEIQANTLPRYLMIPRKEGAERAKHLLSYYGGIRNLENMRRLVDDLAEHYGTTKTMAKSRLIDFGYLEARGILQSENGKLIPSYISGLTGMKTYVVEEKDAVLEMIRNPDLRKLLIFGEYLYVPESSCYCRNDLIYLIRDKCGQLHLTRYAREHMDECCLTFEKIRIGRTDTDVNGVSLKAATPGKGRYAVHYIKTDGTPMETPAGLALRKQIEEEIKERTKYKTPFFKMTTELMKERGLKVDMLSEESGVSERTIVNMRSDKNIQYPYSIVAAVCIAMHLPPSLSFEYLERSRAVFNDTDPYMCLYRYMVMNHYQEPVAKVNRWLLEAGAPPMTNKVEGFNDETGEQLSVN